LRRGVGNIGFLCPKNVSDLERSALGCGNARALLDDSGSTAPGRWGRALHRAIGIVEMVRNPETREPYAPFNGTRPEMRLSTSSSVPNGYTLCALEFVLPNPPAVTNEAERREAFAIRDKGLEDHRPSSS